MTTGTRKRARTIAEVLIENLERIYNRPLPDELRNALEEGGYRKVSAIKGGKLAAEFDVTWW